MDTENKNTYKGMVEHSFSDLDFYIRWQCFKFGFELHSNYFISFTP